MFKSSKILSETKKEQLHHKNGQHNSCCIPKLSDSYQKIRQLKRTIQ